MNTAKKTATRFLYTPTRVGLKLHVFRHRITGKNKEQIIFQRDYHEFRHEFLSDGREDFVDRSELESQGSVRLTRDSWFGDDDECPVGRAYSTRTEAQRALDDWTMITLRKNSAKQPVSATNGPNASEWPFDYEELVNELSEDRRNAPRGVFGIGYNRFIIFGNDASPTDRQYEREVELLRRRLDEEGLAQELDYSMTKDGDKWAMLVYRLCFVHRGDDFDDGHDIDGSEAAFIEIVDGLLWECWFEAGRATPPLTG